MEALMARRHLRFSYTEEGYAKLFKVSMVDAWQLMDREVQKTLDHYYYKKALLNRKSSDAVNVETEIGKRLLKDNCWSYPWQDILSVKGKYSVSELKKIGESDGEPLFDFWGQEETEKEPLFMKMSETDERTTTGSFRGTAYHRVLENLDFASLPDERDENWIWHQLKKMLINGHLSQDQYDKIYVRDIADMVFSDLGRRMGVAAASGKLWKEAQFVVGLPVSMIQKDLDSSDLAVVQGVIDAFFEEDGKLILVDYKTDRVPSLGGEEILRARYERQLLYYRYALEQMMQKKVTESCIYAFALKKVVPIEIQ